MRRLAWLAVPLWVLWTGFLAAATVNTCLQDTGALSTPLGSEQRSTCWSPRTMLSSLDWGTTYAIPELWLGGTVALAAAAAVVALVARRRGERGQRQR